MVIDCDPGIDDLVALVLAARSPELAVIAVTTTHGNAPLAFTTRNARGILALAGRDDIPVHPGAQGPLTRHPAGRRGSHGPKGIGHAQLHLGAAPSPAPPRDTALLDVLRSATAPVCLVTTGPLTNLAHALRGDAALVRRRVARHVAVAGHFGPSGPGAAAPDFNTWSDPEALDESLAAGLPTCLVPVSLSRALLVPEAAVQGLRGRADPVAGVLADALQFAIERQRRVGINGCFVHDAVAVAALIDPRLLDFAEQPLKIGVGEGPDRGSTRPDPAGRPARVAVALDGDIADRLLGRVLGPLQDGVTEGGP